MLSRARSACARAARRPDGLPVVIGKTVPTSLNAVANLGYASSAGAAGLSRRYAVGAPTVLGLRENSNKASGVAWVRWSAPTRRRDGTRLCALGHGAQTRPAGAVAAPVCRKPLRRWRRPI